jgi:hypothetical protein
VEDIIRSRNEIIKHFEFDIAIKVNNLGNSN